MTNIKLYCSSCDECDTFRNEKAPTTNRGLFGDAGEHLNDIGWTSVIITPYAKARKTFMGWHV